MRILLATHNNDKAKELEAVLHQVERITVVTLADVPDRLAEPIEDGATLEENALIKARSVFETTGVPTIADDTGLEVEALGGEPGVRSARYAGDDATYEDNCKKLLRELSEIDRDRRAARFRTVICYCDSRRTFMVEGEVTGSIIETARGRNGFGYDPVFVPDGYNSTFAEMTPEEKNRLSHRGKALRSFVMAFRLFNEIRTDRAG